MGRRNKRPQLPTETGAALVAEGEEFDPVNQINVMSLSKLIVTLDDGRVLIVTQTGRMLLEMHKHFGWDSLGEETSPLECWIWCVWWALSHKDDPIVTGDHVDLSEHIIKLDCAVPKEDK